MKVEPYLIFNGNCREAVEYYAEVFGTEKPQIMTFGEAPADPNHPLSEEAKNLVLHTELNIHGNRVMFSDTPPEIPFVEGNNFYLAIVSNNLDELQTLFHKLKEGGTVIMEFQETFWSKGFAMLTDKFGIKWQLNCSN
jgi:PhnB protein